MTSPLTVHLSRRIFRQLDLGKGMFFDAEAMEELAASGVWDHVHQAAADYQKKEAAERRAARQEREKPIPATVRDDEQFAPVGHSCGSAPVDEDGKEALARARRALGLRRRNAL